MLPGRLKRWLYQGDRPNWIARILNRLDAAIGSSGIAQNYLETLVVVGRKSGREVSLPVAVTTVDGERYLVSMLGKNAQWVLNVRATDGKAALVSGSREDVQLEEIPVALRAPIIKAYLYRAPGARPHIPVSKDAPVEEFEKIAAEYPVFRVVTRSP